MFPHIQIFLKQTQRGTKRLVLQLVLLCAAVAFFVVSLNLYSNSRQNLLTVENIYSTIATMEIYGDVDAQGNLVHPSDEACVGRYWLSVNDYDLSPFRALSYVKDVELRTRVAAYIPGEVKVVREMGEDPILPPDYKELGNRRNTIRFVLDSEDPVTYSLRGGWKYYHFPIRILEQSNPLLVYPTYYYLGIPMLAEKEIPQFADQIRRLNGSDVTDSITLYPSVEYVMITGGGRYWIRDEETGKYIWQEDIGYHDGESNKIVRYPGLGLPLGSFTYYQTPYLYYVSGFGVINHGLTDLEHDYFAIQRYEDIKDDPVWAESLQAQQYTASSFTAVLTDDISLIPAWHQGGMYLHEGRMITEEEYKSGAKVCMISTKMAYLQGWKVGDTLDMHLYEYAGYFDTPVENLSGEQENCSPLYNYRQQGFFDEDVYTIVGIFGRKDLTDIGETSPQVFLNPWDSIYIPSNAVPNAPQGPIQPSLVTIELKNGSINEFKAAVEELGLTEQKPGEYEIKFSYFDQGYSKIQPGLVEMNRNAVLLLGLSAILLLVTMILTAFLFSRQHKHSAGILRMLGGSKGQAFTAILACAAAVVAAGGIVGTILGGALTQSVGTSILGDTATSAAVELATGASPLLTALTGLGCIVLFLLLTAIFTATYINKEPRELLPKDGS